MKKALENMSLDEMIFAEMILRDGEAKQKAKLNRLKAELKVEYDDFQDAKNMAMYVDLGENMRVQLDNIFTILEKYDIEFWPKPGFNQETLINP